MIVFSSSKQFDRVIENIMIMAIAEHKKIPENKVDLAKEARHIQFIQRKTFDSNTGVMYSDKMIGHVNVYFEEINDGCTLRFIYTPLVVS